jgi:hypothetical protein
MTGSMSVLTGLVKWLAASLTAVTAVLYSVGFLAIQAHLHLIGVSHLVDVQLVEYLTTGGRYLYLLPAFLLVGSVLWSPIIVVLFLIRARLFRHPQTTLLVLLLSSILFIVIWVEFLVPEPGLLFSFDRNASNILVTLIRRGHDGSPYLLVTFAALAEAVAIFCALGLKWSRERKHLQAMSKLTSVLELVLCATLAMQIAMLPVTFGMLVMPLRFPHVTVQPARGTNLQTTEGWLMNLTLKADDPLIVYRQSVEGGELVVIPKSSFESVRFVGDSYVFPIQLDRNKKSGKDP